MLNEANFFQARKLERKESGFVDCRRRGKLVTETFSQTTNLSIIISARIIHDNRFFFLFHPGLSRKKNVENVCFPRPPLCQLSQRSPPLAFCSFFFIRSRFGDSENLLSFVSPRQRKRRRKITRRHLLFERGNFPHDSAIFSFIFGLRY